jgi:hypothetical protein
MLKAIDDLHRERSVGMRRAVILMTLLILASAFGQAQTRQQMQEKLLQFLATDLQFTPDQTSTVRGYIKKADNTLSKYETQYFGDPLMVAKMRKQVMMDLGQKVAGILTPGQLEIYPATKQKLYDFLQARYEAGINKEDSRGVQTNEEEEAETNEEEEVKPSEPD